MDKRRVLAAVYLGLLCSGCATPEWPTSEEEVAVWLHEQPRVLAVKVDPALPAPQVQVRDHKAGERVGHGALGAVKGAGVSILGGCVYGGPFGCIAGIIIAPVAAVAGGVVGAVSVDSVDVPHPILEAQGAPELYQRAVSSESVQALFTQALLAASDKAPADGPRLALQAESGGLLGVSVRALDLLGDVGEDPSVSLLLRARAEAITAEGSAFTYPEVVYQGSQRHISAWKADEAKLFREELAAAAKAVAETTLRQVRTAPSASAVQKVLHARDRKREAAAVAAAAPPPPPPVPEPIAVPAPVAKIEVLPTAEKPKGALVGATWEYAFQDRIFTRRKHSFTVRAEAMEGGIVVESFQGDGGMRGSERVATRALAFSGRRLVPGDALIELGPYGLEEALLHEVPAGYPLFDSNEAWRLGASPVVSEQVSVPAGTFKARRVEVSGERSPAGFAGLSGGLWNVLGVTRFRYTAWYAPEVGRYVMARHEQWNPSGAQTADQLVQLVAYRAP